MQLRMGPVSTPKLSHAVVGYFRSLIASGELQPGDALPPETELLKQLGVSRPTLREALRVLESEALIQLGRGARTGATVLQPSIEASAQYASLFLATHGTTLGEIHEVRTLLEPPLAAMLAANKRDDVVRSLQQSVHEQREALAMGDYAAAAVAVNEFHGKLIRSSDNSAFDLIAGMLHNISMKVYPRIALAGRTAADQRLVLRRSVKSTESHERLIELLSSGKAAEAEEFWHRYMIETAKFMKESGLAGLRVGMSASEPIHSLRLRIGNPVRTAPR
jgi:DNA-binding FadR family transcriptional regulator